jgi:hypothetical protein
MWSINTEIYLDLNMDPSVLDTWEPIQFWKKKTVSENVWRIGLRKKTGKLGGKTFILW